MEFHTLGEHCQFENCNRIDFLPLQCKCGKVYCREHFMEHCLSGECELAPKPKDVNLKCDDKIFKCFEKGCKRGSLHEMLCSKCNKHYCIEHRFHPSCPEIDEETLAAKKEIIEAPKRQFREANKHLQEKITENLRKALQSSTKMKTASKIHLMRIKQKAIGPKSIPSKDRVYFAIIKPKTTEPKSTRTIQDVENLVFLETLNLEPDLKDSVAVFVSKNWSLGRSIDSICESCKIINENNRIGFNKLRLFRDLDGYCISPTNMAMEMCELLKIDVLTEGDRLKIEYVNSDVLNDLTENCQLFLSE